LTTLFLSPHLDDVALSCAGRLIDLCERRQEVVVATVFTEGAASTYRKRRAEDRAALASVGAEVRHLGLHDAPFRLGCGFDGEALAVPPGEDDVKLVRDAVARVLDEVQPDDVWFPAGVGGHVDHRAVFAAHQVVPEAAHFYVERPYAFETQMIARHVGLSVHKAMWPHAWLERVVAIVDGYRSQLRWLFDSSSSRTAYEEHAVEHAQFFELVATLGKVAEGASSEST
jgi:LmbE family N-acetylglucosaminyl deacetylase